MTNRTAQPIRYAIRPTRPEAHLFEVRCTVADPDPLGQRFAMAAWIPGSYMIREFAKHVVSIRAMSGRRALTVRKEDKHTWHVAPASGPVTLVLEIFAHDVSVRGAWLDRGRAFFNGTSVFPRVLGREHDPCEVDLQPPARIDAKRWRVATALPVLKTDARGFGAYRATDYDELIDSPVEMGELAWTTFTACGVEHVVAIAGRVDADLERLARDMKRICEAQIRFFGEPAPMDRYVFLVNALADGYGGLEHRASTALTCGRNDLPRAGESRMSDEYRTFLGLVSHEYFHTWNVKRIKPSAFTPYQLDRESYTTQLWAFEGLTSYYDDLMLVRSGVIKVDEYLTLLARNVTNLLRNPGRHRQTVTESSFDAWTKYYRQDENTPNAVVSYYLKGSLVGLCLDLEIRARTRGRKSLDDVMRALWARHGQTGAGVDEDTIERLAQEVSGLDLRRFFDLALRSTGELPIARLLRTQGITMRVRPMTHAQDRGGLVRDAAARPKKIAVWLGARTNADPGGVAVTHVLEGSPAQAAMLAQGDIVVAIDGLRVTSRTFDASVQRLVPGRRVEVHAFRRDVLERFALTPVAAPPDTCDLLVATPKHAGRDRWLGVAP